MTTFGLVDFHHEGHHLAYQALIVRDLLSRDPGNQVMIYTSRAAVRSGMQAAYPELKDSRVVFVPVFESPRDVAARELRRVLLDATTQAECVAIMHADSKPLAVALALVSSLPWRWRRKAISLQIMRPPERGVAPRRVVVTKTLWIALSRVGLHARPVLLISPLWKLSAPAQLLTRWGFAGGQVDLAILAGGPPEPNEELPRVRCGARLALVGGIDERKGVEHLVAAASRLRELGISLVLAGKVQPTVRASIDEAVAVGLVQLDDRYLSNDELLAHIVDADWIWCAYESDLTSGIAVLALALERPIVARAGTRLATFVEREGVGAVVDPSDPLWPSTLTGPLRDRLADPLDPAAFSAREFAAPLFPVGPS